MNITRQETIEMQINLQSEKKSRVSIKLNEILDIANDYFADQIDTDAVKDAVVKIREAFDAAMKTAHEGAGLTPLSDEERKNAFDALYGVTK